MSRELPVPLARHLARLLKRTRRRYRRRLAECQAEFSETSVHELRIETRRALALLDLVAALDLVTSPEKPRRTLKKRLDAFDDLRDTHVQLRRLRPWLKQFPEAREFANYLRESERGLVAELRREIRKLKSRRVARLFKAWEQDVAGVRSESAATAVEILAQPLGEVFARVSELRRKIQPRNLVTIHRTRIAFKKFRYLCELLHALLPGLTPRQLRAMHVWQTRMGDIQDAEVLLNEVERAVKHGKVQLESVKRLHAALARRLVVLVNQFLSTANQLDRFQPQKVLRARKRKPS
ncbi:MAG: CHAD domain-containing protein [Verrucomicrobia bacterium]|nr:MAG: CHAD domain-containing protein [Verrucomicrobiota bacterium]